MSQTAIAHYLSEYDRQQTLPLNWLNERRDSAIDCLRVSGFPTLKNENWKYTDIRPITKRAFTTGNPVLNGVSKKQVDKLRYKELDCHELVFINGNYADHLSTIRQLPAAIILKSLTSVIADNPDILQQHLSQYADISKSVFVALNTAFINEGACIIIPDNMELESPVHLLFITNKQDSSFVTHPRNLIVLGKNSRATVIESYIGLDDAEYFTNTISEVAAADGARLEHYKVQQESLRSFHVGNTIIRQHRDSNVESLSISLGGALARNDIDVDLSAPGASIIMNGLYIANGRQHVDNHTLVNHCQPCTNSKENYRGVLNDRARGVFNGKVIVHEQAQKTDARQTNANLLLSDDAEVDTKPELEIYADDVKCSHGATVGQLDENMLFYLRSRAIEEDTAKSLLTFAFADDVIKQIKFAPIRERLEYIVVGRLPDSSLIREFMQ